MLGILTIRGGVNVGDSNDQGVNVGDSNDQGG